MNSKNRERGAFSSVFHAIFYIFIYFSCQYTVMMMYIMSIMSDSLLVTSIDEETLLYISKLTVEQTVPIMLVSNLLAILFVSFLQTARMRSLTDEFNLKPVNLGRIPTFILFGAALNVFVSGTISLLPLPESLVNALEAQYMSISENESLILVIISIAVVGGITEEIIFRGLVNSRLSRSFGKRAVIIISSVLFGLAHGTPIAVVYAGLLGAVFCIADEKFNSLIPSVLMHVSFNTVSCLMGNLDERWQMPLYIMSIAGVVFCTYRIFIRRPTLYDFVTDMVDEYSTDDEVEQRILEDFHRMYEDGSCSPDEVERLEREWKENELAKKEKAHKSDNSSSDNDNDNNQTKEL